MSTPLPPQATIRGTDEEQGPLVRQPAEAARIATVLHHAATELWDLCTLTDPEAIRSEARAIAHRITKATR